MTEAARQQRLKRMLKALHRGGFTWRYDHVGIAATRLKPDPSSAVYLASHVGAIACETPVICGGRSDYLQPGMVARLQALNPRIESIEITGAGHYIHDDQPAHFAAVVTDFLKREDALAENKAQ